MKSPGIIAGKLRLEADALDKADAGSMDGFFFTRQELLGNVADHLCAYADDLRRAAGNQGSPTTRRKRPEG